MTVTIRQSLFPTKCANWHFSLPNTSDLAFFKGFGSENRFVVNDEKHLATVFVTSILKLN